MVNIVLLSNISVKNKNLGICSKVFCFDVKVVIVYSGICDVPPKRLSISSSVMVASVL